MNTSGDLVFTNNDIISTTSAGTALTSATNVTATTDATTTGATVITTGSATDVSVDIPMEESDDDSSDVSSEDASPDMMGSVTNGGMTVMTDTDMASPNRLNIENVCDSNSFNGACQPANVDDQYSPAIDDSVLSDDSSDVSDVPAPEPAMPDVTGVESDMTEMNEGVVAEEEWSPSETLQKIRMSGGAISSTDFQTLTKELLDKKCWSAEDVQDFLNTVQNLNDLGKDAKTFDESMQVMMTTEYRDMVLDLLKKVDTMNVVCAYEGRCNMIQNDQDRADMVKFLNMINQLVDLYLPVLAAISLQFDKMVDNTSEACQLDPAYKALLIETRNKVFDAMVTRKMRQIETGDVQPTDMPSDVSTDMSTDMSMDMPSDVSTDDSIDMTDEPIMPVAVPVLVPEPTNEPVMPPVDVTGSPFGTNGENGEPVQPEQPQPILIRSEPGEIGRQPMSAYISSYFDNDNIIFTMFVLFLIVLVIVAVYYLSGCGGSAETKKE
jgi:hypothetical protein